MNGHWTHWIDGLMIKVNLFILPVPLCFRHTPISNNNSVMQMLHKQRWKSPVECRHNMRHVLPYKTTNHLAAVLIEVILIQADPHTYSNHGYKFKNLQSKTTLFWSSFSIAKLILCTNNSSLKLSSSQHC